jgi:hypothetical protein
MAIWGQGQEFSQDKKVRSRAGKVEAVRVSAAKKKKRKLEKEKD